MDITDVCNLVEAEALSAVGKSSRGLRSVKRLEAEVLNDPAVSFLPQDIGDRHFFSVEGSDMTRKGGDVVVDFPREKFAGVVIGDHWILLHHLLKQFERKAGLRASGKVAIGFLIIVLTNRFKLRMDNFRRLERSSPEPPGETARDHYKNNEFSHEAFGVRRYPRFFSDARLSAFRPSLQKVGTTFHCVKERPAVHEGRLVPIGRMNLDRRKLNRRITSGFE